MFSVSRRIVLAAPCLGALAMTAARANSGRAIDILAAMPAWMDLASVPGASWAVVDASGAISNGAFGFAKANSMLATPDTLFEAASLSKVVMAVAVHDMVRDGLIDLDRPVSEHVAFTNDPETRAITPRHLLSHSSGLPNWRDEAGEQLESAFTPGSRFRYSGEGFVLLGRLVEAVTGKTAAQVVEARVLRPAGMSHSTYGWARGAERTFGFCKRQRRLQCRLLGHIEIGAVNSGRSAVAQIRLCERLGTHAKLDFGYPSGRHIPHMRQSGISRMKQR
jgi:CubicO group peptidase (beta-lactamase class C family)